MTVNDARVRVCGVTACFGLVAEPAISSCSDVTVKLSNVTLFDTFVLRFLELIH